MSRLRDLSIGKKLYLSFACVLAVIVVLGIVGTTSMSSMNGEGAHVAHNVTPAIAAAADMTIDANRLVRHQRELVAVEPGDRADVENEIDEDHAHFVAAAKKFKRLMSGAGDQAAVSAMQKELARYVRVTSPLVSLVKAGKPERAHALLARADGAYSHLEDSIVQLRAAQDGDVARAEHAVRSAYVSARTITWTLVAIAVALAAALAFLVVRSIAGPLRRLVAAAQGIAEGDVEQT